MLAYAGRPVRTALEIGAGTGKATRAFAVRGIAITATDPDPAMLEQLRLHTPREVTVIQATLEDLRVTQTFDLVYVAAALHWTTTEGRWPRVAALLAPGATFASFGGQIGLADAELAQAAAAARTPFLADDEIPAPDGTPLGSAMQWPGTELLEAEQFTDVRQLVIERRATVTADDYVGYLSTVSAYLQLPAAARQQALGAILDVLPAHVVVASDLHVHLARRT